MKLYQLHILCVVNSCPLLTQTFPNSSLPVKSVHTKATALSKQVPPHTHIYLLRIFLSLFLQKRLAEYTALTTALVHFTARREGNYVRRWSGELPPTAEKLLEFHAVLNDVDALQQACV